MERRASSCGRYTYPSRDECYITVSKTANSNAELTILYEKKVLLPGAGIKDIEKFEKRIGALCDDFKGHSSAECKGFNLGNLERRKNLRWKIMKGGLTPVGQPLDKVVNKVFKGHLRDIYDMWSLTLRSMKGPERPCHQLASSSPLGSSRLGRGYRRSSVPLRGLCVDTRQRSSWRARRSLRWFHTR